MKWLQAFAQHVPQHKYAIDAALLGDETALPWSNLGLWTKEISYPQACHQLACHLADHLNLNSKDRVLDLGCGQGASLSLWKTHYQVNYVEAVELQVACVDKIIKQYQNLVDKIHCGSFLNLNADDFEFKFDAVLCIDAAYHVNLNSFLDSVKTVLNSKARIGFHYLALSAQAAHLNSLERIKLKTLLKAADVRFLNLNSYTATQNILEQQGFEHIQIQNLSEAVFHGFANYVQQSEQIQSAPWSVDRLKIQMTAKLCEKLYREGWIDYVQITAQLKN